jgi:phytoene dehydrogenase-like protein
VRTGELHRRLFLDCLSLLEERLSDGLVEECDAVVIGGGLAGLCAGAYLSRAGLAVVLCEQSDKTGGYFRGFGRDGFYFDAGLKAIENAGMLLPMLRQLGLDKKVFARWSKCCLAFPDRLIPLAGDDGINDFYDNLARHFPESQGGLDALLRDSGRASDLVDVLVNLPNPMFEDYGTVLRRFPSWTWHSLPAMLRSAKTRKLMDVPLVEHLSRHVSDQALVRLLTQFYFAGTPALFGLGYSRMYMDYYYPEGGMQRITDALGGFILDHRGSIKTGCRVTKIEVEDGCVTGVLSGGGKSIKARFVIAACDMKSVFLEMLDRGDLDSEYRDEVENAGVGESAVNLFVATDLDPSQLTTGDCPHVFFFPDYKGVDDRDRERDDYFTRAPLEISIPCLNDPALAPRGKTGFIFSALTSASFAGNWGTLDGERSAKHLEIRQRVASDMLSNAENLYPGLKGHVLFSELSTPLTLQRFTLNSGGSIVGWTYDRERTYKRGYSVGMRKAVTTPISNLLQAGHWTLYPGGAPMSILSGRLAAERIASVAKRHSASGDRG